MGLENPLAPAATFSSLVSLSKTPKQPYVCGDDDDDEDGDGTARA